MASRYDEVSFGGSVLNLRFLMLFVCLMFGAQAFAQDAGASNYRLGAGDVIRVNVFQHADLTLETRVAENGLITYPLIGAVAVGGQTLADAERTIAANLKKGRYVQNPQVNISLLQVRSNQVSVLGQVNNPGRIPLDTAQMYLADVLAMAGGITERGSDKVVVTGTRGGKAFRQEVDVPGIFEASGQGRNILLMGGDVLFVPRAEVYYIYGEVQRPGAYRIERGMTVQQAIAQGGGLTSKGTERGIKLQRRNEQGKFGQVSPGRQDIVQADDVINIGESIF